MGHVTRIVAAKRKMEAIVNWERLDGAVVVRRGDGQVGSQRNALFVSRRGRRALGIQGDGPGWF